MEVSTVLMLLFNNTDFREHQGIHISVSIHRSSCDKCFADCY